MMDIYFLIIIKFIFDTFKTFLLFTLHLGISIAIWIGFILFFVEVYKLFKKK